MAGEEGRGMMDACNKRLPSQAPHNEWPAPVVCACDLYFRIRCFKVFAYPAGLRSPRASAAVAGLSGFAALRQTLFAKRIILRIFARIGLFFSHALFS